jgi:hypothetical protein
LASEAVVVAAAGLSYRQTQIVPKSSQVKNRYHPASRTTPFILLNKSGVDFSQNMRATFSSIIKIQAAIWVLDKAGN